MMLPALAVSFWNTFNYSFHHSNCCCVISASVLPEVKLSLQTANSIINEANHSQKKHRKYTILRIKKKKKEEPASCVTRLSCTENSRELTFSVLPATKFYTQMRLSCSFVVHICQVAHGELGLGNTQRIVVSVLSLARSHINTNLVRTAQLAKSTSPVSWGSHHVSWYSHCSLLTVPTARSRAGGPELKTSQMKYPFPLSHPSLSSFSVYLHQE